MHRRSFLRHWALLALPLAAAGVAPSLAAGQVSTKLLVTPRYFYLVNEDNVLISPVYRVTFDKAQSVVKVKSNIQDSEIALTGLSKLNSKYCKATSSSFECGDVPCKLNPKNTASNSALGESCLLVELSSAEDIDASGKSFADIKIRLSSEYPKTLKDLVSASEAEKYLGGKSVDPISVVANYPYLVFPRSYGPKAKYIVYKFGSEVLGYYDEAAAKKVFAPPSLFHPYLTGQVGSLQDALPPKSFSAFGLKLQTPFTQYNDVVTDRRWPADPDFIYLAGGTTHVCGAQATDGKFHAYWPLYTTLNISNPIFENYADYACVPTYLKTGEKQYGSFASFVECDAKGDGSIYPSQTKGVRAPAGILSETKKEFLLWNDYMAQHSGSLPTDVQFSAKPGTMLKPQEYAQHLLCGTNSKYESWYVCDPNGDYPKQQFGVKKVLGNKVAVGKDEYVCLGSGWAKNPCIANGDGHVQKTPSGSLLCLNKAPVVCDKTSEGTIKNVNHAFDALCSESHGNYNWTECNADKKKEGSGDIGISDAGIVGKYLCNSYAAGSTTYESWHVCGGEKPKGSDGVWVSPSAKPAPYGGNTCTADGWRPPECTTSAQCDDGVGCTVESCVNWKCAYSAAPGTCLIDMACWKGGETSIGDSCKVCNPKISQKTWSKPLTPACGGAQHAPGAPPPSKVGKPH